QHLGLACREADGTGRLVGISVKSPFAVTGDFAVGLPGDGQMNGSPVGLGFFGAVKRSGATKMVAAGHPAPGLLLSQDDGIELDAVESLHADHAAAALVELIQLHPGFERLLREIAIEGRGEDSCLPPGELQLSVADHGISLRGSVE